MNRYGFHAEEIYEWGLSLMFSSTTFNNVASSKPPVGVI
jgi:hypothetical protein